MYIVLLSVILILNGSLAFVDAFAAGNVQIDSFAQAKRHAKEIHLEQQVTIYCPCRYKGKTIDLASCGYTPYKSYKRARRLEWEHVVPAEAFGKSFSEWRDGADVCRKGKRSYKGRKCARRNRYFARMEADLYNLWPSVGELNGLRSNYSMAQIPGAGAISFGKCSAKVEDRKFEPMDEFKGVVARTYFYMESQYPGRGIVSNKNMPLFQAWDNKFPATPWECKRAGKIAAIQKNENPVLKSRCSNQVNRPRS